MSEPRRVVIIVFPGVQPIDVIGPAEVFHTAARIDPPGIWINNIRLLFIVRVPFTSSLVTDYSELLLGRILLPINFFLAILAGWAQWAWAMRNREECLPGLSASEARREGRGALSAVLISLAVVVASPWIGSAAFLLFVFDGLLTRALGGAPPTEAGGEGRADTAPDPRR